jgi:hypothetical protein
MKDMGTVLLNNVSGNKVTEIIEFIVEDCIHCGISFMMPSSLKKQLKSNGHTFYCPNGHTMVYRQNPTEEELKIKELERKLQSEKNAYNVMTNTMLDERKKARQLKTQLNRVHKGVCPCCNRTFINLQNHMKNKHPESTDSAKVKGK